MQKQVLIEATYNMFDYMYWIGALQCTPEFYFHLYKTESKTAS